MNFCCFIKPHHSFLFLINPFIYLAISASLFWYSLIFTSPSRRFSSRGCNYSASLFCFHRLGRRYEVIRWLYGCATVSLVSGSAIWFIIGPTISLEESDDPPSSDLDLERDLFLFFGFFSFFSFLCLWCFLSFLSSFLSFFFWAFWFSY